MIDLSNINYTYIIIAGVVSLIALLFSGLSHWVIKKRVYYASKCGRCEHTSGRLVGVLLIVTFFIEYFDLKIYEISLSLILIILTFVIWLIYLVSHLLEKTLYSSYGPRG